MIIYFMNRYKLVVLWMLTYIPTYARSYFIVMRLPLYHLQSLRPLRREVSCLGKVCVIFSTEHTLYSPVQVDLHSVSL